jgi:GT2 family glycosyltransferase
MSDVGVVIIGRNEGSRLVECLASLVRLGLPMVYVDSGSTDGSQQAALNEGADVVDLDLSRPFTAARARNCGFRRLCQQHSACEFVQFLDGDCVLQPAWLASALPYLQSDSKLGVVCGRRRERFPEKSVYNRLCDMEWDTPVGPAGACGGDALMRRTAFDEVQGFDESLIAGEEPELCLRLRKAGWGINRVDAEMTLHDAAMTRFRQWWQRARRAGHAYAENAWVHRADGMWRREARSIFFWGMVIPIGSLIFAPLTFGASLLALLAYPLLVLKILISRRRKLGFHWALLYALACVGAKFPQALGMMAYHFNRLSGRRAKLIEYKLPVAQHESRLPG